MGLIKKSARKTQLIAEITIVAAVLTSEATLSVIDMQSGSVVDDVYVVVDELFDPTTSAVVEAGTSGATAKFVSSQDIFTGAALGGRAGVATGKGYRFTAPGSIAVKYTSGGGTSTTGQLRLVVAFHYENEADFSVGE